MSLKNPEAIHLHIFGKRDSRTGHVVGGKTYFYSIPGYHRYSAEYNRTVGHLSTGSKKDDIAAMSEYVNVAGTIEEILRLFEKGSDIKFHNREDMVEIYEVLVTHINNWVYHVTHDPNVKNAPLNSLQLMAEFAESIRPIVIGYKPKIEDIPELSRVKALFGSVAGIEALFTNTGLGEKVDSPEPLVDRIADMLNQRRSQSKGKR